MHKQAQRRMDIIGATRRARALSLPSANARPWPAGARSREPSDRLGRPVWLDYLQMQQQSLAKMGVQGGRVVTRWQESRDR